jgi:hypothetical protein
MLLATDKKLLELPTQPLVSAISRPPQIHTSSGASIAVNSHATLRHVPSADLLYFGIFRCTAVQTQRVKVMKQEVSMLDVPRA